MDPMTSFMLWLSNLLRLSLNWLILLVAIAEFVIMVITFSKMSHLRGEIDDMNKTPGMQLSGLRKRNHTVQKEFRVTGVELDWTRFDLFCNRYQMDCQWYSAFSMIIQLFTLLGILGTVAGLFISLMHMNDLSKASELLEGIKMALSSTILGIIS